MDMEMTTREKDSLFARIVSEHFSTQKNNPVCVPIEHLKAKGFDVSDSNNALWRLKDRGTIKNYKHCWGLFEVENGKKIFIITGEEKPETDDDFEAYKIEVVPGRLAQAMKSRPEQTQENDASIIYLDKNGDLYRVPRDKFCYPMSGKGIPLKILKYFADNSNVDYEQDTASTAAAIGISADQLRKEINKMRNPIKNSLKLKASLIDGRRGSGYRLNPNIEIVPEN